MFADTLITCPGYCTNVRDPKFPLMRRLAPAWDESAQPRRTSWARIGVREESRFLLLEQASQNSGRIAGLLLARSGSLALLDSEPRFEQTRGDASDVRQKLRVGPRALDQKRNLHTTARARCLLPTEQAAHNIRDRATESARDSARHGRDHFEVEVVLRIDRSGADEIAERGNHRFEVLRPQAVGGHVDVRGHHLDREVGAGLEVGERADRRHLRSENEARELGVGVAYVAGDDVPMGRAGDIEVNAERAGSEGRALRELDAERREEGLEVPGGHVLSVELETDDGDVRGRQGGAGEAGACGADADGGRIENAGVPAQGVPRGEIHAPRHTRGRTARDAQQLVAPDLTFG